MKKNSKLNYHTLKIILSVLCASALNLPLTVMAAWTDTGTATLRANGGVSGTASGTFYQTTADGSAGRAFWVYTTSTLWASNVTINTSGSGAMGLLIQNNSYAGVDGLTIATNTADGIRLESSSSAGFSNVNITVTDNSGPNHYGLYVNGTSHVEIDGLTVAAIDTADGIRLEHSSSASLSNVNITVNSSETSTVHYGVFASGTSHVEVDGLTVTAVNAEGIRLRGSSGNFSGVNITTTGMIGVSLDGGAVADLGDGAVIRVSGSYVGPRTSRGINVSGTGSVLHGSGMDIETDGVYLSGTNWEGIQGVKAENGGVIDLGENTHITTRGVTGDGRRSGGIFVQNNGVVTGTGVVVNAEGTAVAVMNGGYVELVNGTLSGGQNGIIVGGTQVSEIVITGATITAQGDIVHGSANSTITISDAVLNASGLVGTDQDGLLVVNLNNVDASNAGGITMDSETSGTTTVTVNGGSGIYGDVTNSGSGELDVSFDHSGLTGDVTNDGDGTLTINLDNGSSGTGGFNGGNLNINDGNSLWTFDKDSHVNDALNNGTLNIGDKDVTFDNIVNNGKINLDVNSDTGAGGSVNVTGTAGGNGSVHIDTTGNGSLDPNSVLPGLVTGDGTENWQWDPVEWGLETVVKDGDRFIRDGISTAGAVLNSSNVVQQAMWFAQQNSLLKRMGELRLNNEMKGVKSEKSLIENTWIRSHGQRLNVGRKVAGHAYEQMVYGVDLGADHKWTLDDHNVLYLGIYAGYGRSDIDYRAAGTDGELNSYYGGLYAAWLHDSGLYIDFTLKAAGVDNELQAGNIRAGYNDLNLGGSIEIGRKFSFRDGWFVEPQLQAGYLRILAEDYRAAGMMIEAQDLDALQFRAGSLFGRTIKLANGGALQPYLKASGVEMASSGGAIRNGYQRIRSNIDGTRAELGGGIIWQMDGSNQLHFDYEAGFGDKYDKPWGLTAGYRHRF